MRMPYFLTENDVWLGSENSLIALLHSWFEMGPKLSADPKLFIDDEDEDEEAGKNKHRMLSVHGNVGVVTIRGSLTYAHSPWNRFFGLTSYTDIRNAVVTAVNHPEVQTILLDIGSEGGTATGLEEASTIIRQADKKMKPVHAFTSMSMHSAAYWLGAQARKIYTTRMASLGSIGVIVAHKEYSKMLQDAGINVTIIRSGKYKALGHPAEPLTEEAREEIQAKSDEFYGMFIQAVAEGRGVPEATVRAKMAEGRTFLGEHAVSVGLADSVGFFDEIVARLQGAGNPRGNRSSSVTGARVFSEPKVVDHMGKKVALTKQAQAALAAGASMEELEKQNLLTEAEDETETELETPETDNTETGDPEVTTETEEPEVTTETEDPEVELDAGKGAKGDASLDRLLALNTQLAKAESKIEDLTAKLESQAALIESFEAIARAAIDRMNIGLGGHANMADKVGGVALVELYESTLGRFNKHFKVGGVAKLDAKEFDRGTAQKKEAQKPFTVKRGLQAIRLK